MSDLVTISKKLFNAIVRDINRRGHYGERVLRVEIVRRDCATADDDGYVVHTDKADTAADAGGW